MWQMCGREDYVADISTVTTSGRETQIVRVETSKNAGGLTGYDEVAVTLSKRVIPIDLEGEDPPPPPPVSDVIVDDADPGSSVLSGAWVLESEPGTQYKATLRYKQAGSRSGKCQWTATLPVAGLWEVSAWWVDNPNRGTNVPYVIHPQTGTATVRVKQQQNGGAWQSLGTYPFASGPATVEVSDDANGCVIADAVCFHYVGQETTPPTAPTALAATAAGAIGLYTYYERVAQGLRQLMAGSRKFAVEYIARDDIAALTREAADISGLKHIMEVDQAEVESILST